VIDRLVWRGDGQLLAAGCKSGRIYVWDLRDRRPPKVLEGHTQLVWRLAFSRAGDRLVSSSWDSRMPLWDPVAGTQLFSFMAPGFGDLQFDPDDHLLAATIEGTRLKLWEVDAGREYRTLARHPGPGWNAFHDGTVSPDGRLLAVGMYDGVRLWDLATGQELAYLPLGPTSAVFEPNGRGMLTSGTIGVRRWPLSADPRVEGTLCVGPPKPSGPATQARHLALSQDGRRAAVLNGAGASVVLNLDQQPAQALTLGNHPGANFVAISP